jgi:hypothetical protein
MLTGVKGRDQIFIYDIYTFVGYVFILRGWIGQTFILNIPPTLLKLVKVRHWKSEVCGSRHSYGELVGVAVFGAYGGRGRIEKAGGLNS